MTPTACHACQGARGECGFCAGLGLAIYPHVKRITKPGVRLHHRYLTRVTFADGATCDLRGHVARDAAIRQATGYRAEVVG